MLVEPSLVPLPAGEVTLGDARTGTSRNVAMSAFSIGRFATGDGEPHPIPTHGISWFDAVDWCNRFSTQHGISPAYTITGRDVHWHVESRGYRLPTEAEWEYACRAGSTGTGYGELSQIAWTATDGEAGPHPGGLKEPNDFGLYDTLGNVWEWCWDYLDPARYADYRVLRGGGWADKSWSVRASVRRGSAPDAIIDDVGFRVARGAVGETGGESAQGWSRRRDEERANIAGPVRLGWTPLGRPRGHR